MADWKCNGAVTARELRQASGCETPACAGNEKALKEAESCLEAAAHWCGSSHGARVLRLYRRAPLPHPALPALAPLLEAVAFALLCLQAMPGCSSALCNGSCAESRTCRHAHPREQAGWLSVVTSRPLKQACGFG